MKVSIVIPCYNESATIGEVLQAIRAAPLDEIEIVVVDDGSIDSSRALLQGELAPLINRLVLHAANQGKGAAMRSGFAVATGEIILVQDADLEYQPREFPKLIAPIANGEADAVFGSRFIGGQPHRAAYFWHMAGNKLITLVSNICTNLSLTDIETGAKAFRASSLSGITIEEDRFGFEPEITAKLARAGCRIYEVGISYHGRTYAEGKKVTWRDGLRAIYAIVKYSFRPQ